MNDTATEKGKVVNSNGAVLITTYAGGRGEEGEKWRDWMGGRGMGEGEGLQERCSGVHYTVTAEGEGGLRNGAVLCPTQTEPPAIY